MQGVEEGVSKPASPESDFPTDMRVLIVDPSRKCIDELRGLMAACRYTVSEATSGKAALDLLNKDAQLFDLIVAEWDLPDIEFSDFLKLIRTQSPCTPVVVSTEVYDPLKIRTVGKLGVCGFLKKPPQLREVDCIWLCANRTKIRTLSPASGRKVTSPLLKPKENTNKRFCWDKKRHESFLRAVVLLGASNKAKLKLIQKIMLESGELSVTYIHISSQLQKFRDEENKRRHHKQEKSSRGNQSILSTEDAATVASVEVAPIPAVPLQQVPPEFYRAESEFDDVYYPHGSSETCEQVSANKLTAMNKAKPEFKLNVASGEHKRRQLQQLTEEERKLEMSTKASSVILDPIRDISLQQVDDSNCPPNSSKTQEQVDGNLFGAMKKSGEMHL